MDSGPHGISPRDPLALGMMDGDGGAVGFGVTMVALLDTVNVQDSGCTDVHLGALDPVDAFLAALLALCGEDMTEHKFAGVVRLLVRPPLLETDAGRLIASRIEALTPGDEVWLEQARRVGTLRERLAMLTPEVRGKLQWNTALVLWRGGVLGAFERVFCDVLVCVDPDPQNERVSAQRLRRDTLIAFFVGNPSHRRLSQRLERTYGDPSGRLAILMEHLSRRTADKARWLAQQGNTIAFAFHAARAEESMCRLEPVDSETLGVLKERAAALSEWHTTMPFASAKADLERLRNDCLMTWYAHAASSGRGVRRQELGEKARALTSAWEAFLLVSALEFLGGGAFARVRGAHAHGTDGANASVRKTRVSKTGLSACELWEFGLDALANGEAISASDAFLKVSELPRPDPGTEARAAAILWLFASLSSALASAGKPLASSWQKKLRRAEEVLHEDGPLASTVDFLLLATNGGEAEIDFRRRVMGLLSRRSSKSTLESLCMGIVARALGMNGLASPDNAERSPNSRADASAFRWIVALEDGAALKKGEALPFRHLRNETNDHPLWLRQFERIGEHLGFLAAGTDAANAKKKAAATIVRAPRLIWRLAVAEDSLSVLPLEQAWTRDRWGTPKLVPLSRLVQEAGRATYDLTPQDLEILACVKNAIPPGGWRKEWVVVWPEALPALAKHPSLVLQEGGALRPLKVVLAKPLLAACRRSGRIVFELVATGVREGWCWWWTAEGELAVARMDARGERAFDLLRAVEIPEADAQDGRLGDFLGRLGDIFDLALERGIAGAGGLTVESKRLPVTLRIEPSKTGADASFFLSAFVKLPGASSGEERKALPGEPPASFLARDGGGISSWVARDLAAEAGVLAGLKEFLGAHAFFVPSWNDLARLLSYVASQDEAFVIEWPDAGGSLVSTLDAVTFKMAGGTGESDVYAWFEPGERTAKALERAGVTLAALIEAVSARKEKFVVLDSGGVLALSDEVRVLLEDLALVGGTSTSGRGDAANSARLSSAASYALSQAHPGAFEGEAGFPGLDVGTASIEGCAKANGLAVGHAEELHDALHARLRGYQREGVEWIVSRWRRGFGVCLADDMGLGKTLQAIAALELVTAPSPALVVCPTSVVGNWESELTRFAKMRLPAVFPNTARAEFFEALPSAAVVIVSYQTLQSNADAFAARAWSALVLDEAQMLKNADAKRRAAVAALRVPLRMALSGTPVENRIEEIHSLLDVLNPGLFGSAASFRRKFGGGASTAAAAGDRKALARVLRPFLLRRTREQVLVDLPERFEETRLLAMTDVERVRYESYRAGALKFLESSDLRGGDRIEAFTWLLRLRQACSHPETLGGASERSAKEQELSELLAENKTLGRRTLVFSQFLPTLRALEKLATVEGHRAFLFIGETAREERDSLVERFQAGEADVLFMSLRAGGIGLNLTGADCVVHFDPWWNPALEAQATARAHRMGRRETVHVVRFCYSDSVEERMLALHETKKQLSEDLLGGRPAEPGEAVSNAESGLSMAEIRALFDEP